ncbi:MAG: GGDEF domain-containing protein [Ruminococcus sp.]|nr:GGDEF domain-containing protein [Ruminococcus sp.]
MKRNDKKSADAKKMRWLKILMIFGYGVIVLVAMLIVATLAVDKTDEVLKDKVSSLTGALNVQMKLNMESYQQRIETIGTLAFSVEEAYTYDATDDSNDEYEALNTESAISDSLYNLCIMENFVDFCIVYKNNHTVGKFSNGTTALFGDDLYTALSENVTQQRTSDGWFAGYNNDFQRIYYVKRIHENAILLISIYSTELESVFDNPESMEEMTVCLTEQGQNVIYSSDKQQVGQPLSDDILSRVGDLSSATVMDDTYLITVNECSTGWYVICSIPTQIIFQEKNEITFFIYAVGLIAAALAILFGSLFSIRVTTPMDTMLFALDTKAHIDQLTGILNKRSFEEYTDNAIKRALGLENHALILLDIDNFKKVNDTLGHAYGDKVLENVGSILRQTFSESDYMGRVGGDEFCIYLNGMASMSKNDAEYYVKKQCEKLCEAFHNNYTGDDFSYKISASIGVALFPKHAKTFKSLYICADKALYSSKQKGKDTYTIYDKATEV